MYKIIPISGALFLLTMSVFGQLNLKEQAELVGIQVSQSDTPDSLVQSTEISFIFNGKPRTFYHSIDDKAKAVVVDFFDAIKSDITLPAVNQTPFTNSTFEMVKVNTNRDIEGLEADYRDVLRVSLELEKGVAIEETATDDYNVITVSARWTRNGILKPVQIVTPSAKWKIYAGLFTGALVATAIIAWPVDPPPPPPPSGDWTPAPLLP